MLINRSLQIEDTQTFTGMISGDVMIEGGTVELRGMVSGTVYNNACQLQMESTAMLRSQVIWHAARS